MVYRHDDSRDATRGHQDDPEASDNLERHERSLAFKNAHTSLGVAGHLVHMGAMLFPVLAAELIPDAAKYRKAVRLGSVFTTVLYEGLYTMRELQRREQQEAKLAECTHQNR